MILGQFAGGPAVRTDYNQTDPSKADYLVGRENIENHLANENNPHGVTAAQAGAAPAGYGLGDGGIYLSSLGLTVDTIARGGFYRWDVHEGAPFSFAAMIVAPRTGNTSAAQLAFCHSGANTGVMATRMYAKDANIPWEYINPPMVAGTEYRTTERWNGKAVYAKLVNYGTMPNNTQKSVSVPTTGATQVIYAEGIARHSAGVTHVPLGGHLAVAIVTEIFSTNITLTLQASADFSAWSAMVLLKYVK